ncbi:hypothetical protein [Amycolatopsis rifamycinica]|uniref:Uncharacterized protein n=1 Tax=Amycolatopsis rifamycinica TaxID=287986 RepID=A0A066TZM7_9PSEU|nr:hypothetical protein [Amycolatopsis rifamycinica]KDN20285.1 hypothetical protein DV20_20235 [Amycolatopsis rifamycinica]
MTTQRTDPRVLVAVGTWGALIGAGAGVFWIAMSGRYDHMCDGGEETCGLGVWFLGLVVFVATAAGSSLLTLFAVNLTRLRPKPPVVVTALLAPAAFVVVYNVTGALGVFRILPLAAVSALLQVLTARRARIGVR